MGTIKWAERAQELSDIIEASRYVASNIPISPKPTTS
jgi:hypothetical protein